MIISVEELRQQNRKYVDVRGKIGRFVKSGTLIPVVRGLYETDINTPGRLLAAYIYGPSYLSFDYALAYHSLIPEATCRTYTSATFNKRRRKSYDNFFGTFTYRDVPGEAYPYGITVREEDGRVFQIATPEKALCDKLYSLPPVGSLRALRALLFDDLRVDPDEFAKLNANEIRFVAPLYRSTNLSLLTGLVKET